MGGDEEDKINKKTVKLGREVRVFEETQGKVDILCVTESHLREDNVGKLSHKYLGFSWIHELTTTLDKFAGVSIGYKWWMPKPVDLLAEEWKNYNAWVAQGKQMTSSYAFKNLNIIKGRLQVVVFQLEEIDIIVCNLYGLTSAPGHSRYEFICLTIRLIEMIVKNWKLKFTSRKVSVMLGGDFNACSNRMVKISSSSYNNEHEKKKCVKCNVDHDLTTMCATKAMDLLEEIFTHVNDIDPFLDNLGKYCTFEHWEANKCTRWSGIDHIYIMPACHNVPLYMPEVTFWHGRPMQTEGSGHHLLAIKLLNVWTCSVNRKAKGIKAPFKRLPAWLFEEEEFMAKIALEASSTLEKMKAPNASCCKLWDSLYLWIPVYAREYLVKKKKRLAQLQKSLLGKNIGKPEIRHQLEEVEAEWELLDPTISSVGPSDCGIAGARAGPDRVYTKPSSIQDHVYTLFSEKFKAREDYSHRQRSRLTKEWMEFAPQKISEEHSLELELCIIKANIIKAIKSMKKDAAPGVDGIPLLLFTHPLTTEVLAEILVLVAEDAMKNGRLPDSLRKAVIRLLQKEGKDNTDIMSGKRPISLMSIPLRILAKCIATALSPFMDSWIGDHQKAYVCGRRIEVNTAIMSMLLQEAQDVLRDDLQFLMLLEVDFRSAFDTVDHDFIKALLQHIGIGEKVAKLIMLIVGTLKASVIINSQLSDWFKIKRGVPQGCSLSGLLFILVLECIFKKAFSDPSKYGGGVSLLQGSTNKVLDTTFADDVNIFQTDPRPLSAWVNMFQDFSIPSGLGINADKTRINLIGNGFWGTNLSIVKGKEMISQLRTLCPAINTIVAGDDVKTVGIIISAADHIRGVDITSKSWLKRIESFTSYARFLKYRMKNQPMLVKTTTLNEQLSRLWYPAMNCPISISQASEIFQCVDAVVWNYGSPLLKRSMYTQPPSAPGGLGAPNPTLRIQAFQVMWLKLLVTSKLPASLEECLTHQLMSGISKVTGRSMVRRGQPPSVVQIVNWFLNIYAEPTQRDQLLSFYGNPAMKRKLFSPLFIAFDTLHKLPDIPDTVEEWGAVTTKNIYDSLLLTTLENQVPDGQSKWTTRENINIDWSVLWDVIASLRTQFKDLHDGLYNVIVRRFIIKTRDRYSACSYCPQPAMWEPVHALFDCPRIKPVWTQVGESVTNQLGAPFSMQEVFLLCQQIPLSKKRRPLLSLAHLLILCAIAEILRWVKEHENEDGDTYSHEPGLEFKTLLLSKIWRRVSKYRPELEHSDPDVPGNREGIGVPSNK